MQPVKVESGELIFSPGSFGPEIPALNNSVPRFQNGGQVSTTTPRYQRGGNIKAVASTPTPQVSTTTPRYQRGGNIKAASPKADPQTNVQHFVTNRFNEANQTMNNMDNAKQQPIVVPVPMPAPPSGSGGGESGSAIPALSSSPSNHIVSSLTMSSYALMRSIG